MTSPQILAAAASQRTEAEARSMMDTIRKGVPSTFRAGQTSLGEMILDESALMADVIGKYEALRAAVEAAQKRTDITAIDERLGDFLAGLESALSDASLSDAAWSAEIEKLRA